MKKFIASIQEKPYATRLKYFWAGVAFAFLFSVGILSLSFSGLMAEFRTGGGGKDIAKSVENLPTLRENFKGLFSDAKALFSGASSGTKSKNE